MGPINEVSRALAVSSAAMATAAAISGQGVFACRLVACASYVATSIPGLISLEVIEALRSVLR
jgi:hypothetical protein